MAEYYSEFFSGVIIWRVMEGRLEILCVPTTFNGGLQVKVPGGKDEEGETPAETAVREVREETGLAVGPLMELEKARWKDPLDGHVKYFFLTSFRACQGVLRTESIVSRDKPKVLHPPEFRQYEDLERNIFPTHKPALTVAARWFGDQLAKTHPGVASQLQYALR
ncbi:MAG: NUDIX domain-containing protein [Candidatus Paceibacterota bacterium]